MQNIHELILRSCVICSSVCSCTRSCTRTCMFFVMQYDCFFVQRKTCQSNCCAGWAYTIPDSARSESSCPIYICSKWYLLWINLLSIQMTRFFFCIYLCVERYPSPTRWIHVSSILLRYCCPENPLSIQDRGDTICANKRLVKCNLVTRCYCKAGVSLMENQLSYTDR